MAVQVQVIHDFDYGWIVETDENGEWEFEPTITLDERGELISYLSFKEAVSLGKKVAAKHGAELQVFTKKGQPRKRAA